MSEVDPLVTCDLCGSYSNEVFADKHDLRYLRCLDCGFVFSDTSQFDFAAFNKEIIEDLRDTHVGKLASARHLKAYERLLRDFEPYRQNGRLLEIGCSTGSFLITAKSAGWDEFGVEPVESSARHGIEQLGLNIHIGTLETAGLESGSFDVAYSNAVVEHLQHPAEVIEEAFRVLRPGGLFFADTVNLESYTWKFLGPRWKLFDPRMHLSLFTPDTLRAYCEKAGFEVLGMQTHGVRFHATRADRPTGFRRLLDELRKAPYSWAARYNLKGDNIAVYARRPTT
ncbi:MAG: class I SAM-dependent methyltransferase [Gammaproteobacteria bacterium]|nr:class I SAM-dependent methyltransferase [Gammaproteobacteria bacterium]